MKLFNDKQFVVKGTLLLIFAIIILIEILDILGVTTLFSNHNIELLLHIVLIISTFSLMTILIKGDSYTTTELRNSNIKLNNIFESIDVAIWSHDLRTDQLLITPGIERLYGHRLEEFYQDTLLWKKVIHPDDLYVLKEREEQLLNGYSCTSVYRIIRPNGEVRWIKDRGIPELDTKGQLVYFTSVLFDMSDRKESEDQYRSLVEMSPDIIAVIIDKKISYINEAGSKLLDADSPDELVDKEVLQFTTLRDMAFVKREINHKMRNTRFEITVYGLKGRKIDVELTAMPILYQGREGFQVVGRDITERKKSEKMIRQMAFYDSLTKIPNRNMFKQRLNEAIQQESNKGFAIFFIDLDRFKVINDTKGHTVGDRILVKVANRLSRAVGKRGQVFRQGGDEFLILLENVDKEQVIQEARNVIDKFSQSFEVDEQEFFVTPSIGISMYPIDGIDQESLVKHADSAMYVAKDRGKNNFQFYHDSMDRASARKIELENGLRKAIELNQMILHYQPKIHLASRNVLGVEALIRWEHPTFGIVSPQDFIPLAEETGLIVPIGKWVMKTACEQSKLWERKGIGKVPIAVNISVRQIQDDHFVDDVSHILAETNFDPTLLELEITESIMQDFERSTRILNELKKLGVTISMDDFGTGYSSLSNLRYLPLDHIKIDKSFVDDIIHHSYQGSIVKAIIDMGLNLQFQIIAEGIEEEEQVAFLLENGCNIGQGYHFSKPLPAELLESYLISQDIML
ncbi:EAL domain-containing protein [Cytobacillus spongiae]|uniref:bifunctional diguanylate cyclase/phosphodiesterase n=1 Tax=Cytobacillus spongiae TaxID=2901381 RepID=UPI001F2F60A2|nr:GGDEF and EAL domain-containing protein [Cytobacillus spongiae]UII55498.1 EAL domain-containing protein [Cytobacillus spongiae]